MVVVVFALLVAGCDDRDVTVVSDLGAMLEMVVGSSVSWFAPVVVVGIVQLGSTD